MAVDQSLELPLSSRLVALGFNVVGLGMRQADSMGSIHKRALSGESLAQNPV